MKAWVGVDNGVSGSLAFIDENGKVRFAPTPTKSEQSYTKSVQQITRIDGNKLYTWLLGCIESLPGYQAKSDRIIVVIERPFVNPKGFKATLSGMRALEATMIVCESLLLPMMFIDSKEWQRELLPQGCEGAELKKASLDIGLRLFPQITHKHKDRDSILIAEYARRKGL